MIMEELLNKYDVYHSSIVNGGKIKFNINYLPLGNVYISLVALINGEEKKYTVDFLDDNDFKNVYLPKILEHFFSKNKEVHIRKIMGNSTHGTLVVQREDLSDCLIIRNCSIKTMNLVESIYKSYTYINADKVDASLLFDENSFQYDNYLKYNIIYDYSKYRRILFNEKGEIDKDLLFLLNIARYAYSIETIPLKESLDEVEKIFEGNEKVVETCDLFQANDYSDDSIFSRILSLAEFEKHNDTLILNNKEIVEEADKACKEGINYFDDSFVKYWNKKFKEYEKSKNKESQDICKAFIDSHDLSDNTFTVPVYANNGKDKELISKIKEINKNKFENSSVVDTPKEENPNSGKFIISPIDSEEIKRGAEDQARKIIELEKEREELIEAADEYARIILKNAQEYEMIRNSAEDQARRIIELEKQNEELKKMAEENARDIFDKEKLYQEEGEQRKELDDTPVKSQDIDKINNLLYAISTVKNLDFAVSHPTVSQELSILEEKIITYLTTHKNIVHEEEIIVPIEKEEMVENKPVLELLSMIRNTYESSHSFEKDGRHTVISFTPVDEDTYRVSLYSVKDDVEDLLMDVFFEQYQITDSVLEELCNIYKEGAVVVANKIDNIPPDKADFLAIDNMNNAIKFMECNRDIIDKVKEYI